MCAVVLYDYEAAEENEMPLTEGEVVEQIEQVDEGTLGRHFKEGFVCLS